MTILGNRIEEARLNQGISQAQLARMLGVTKETVSKWESGDKEPTPEHLRDLGTVLKVSSDHLLGIERQQVISVQGLKDEDVCLLQSVVLYMRNKNTTQQFLG